MTLTRAISFTSIFLLLIKVSFGQEYEPSESYEVRMERINMEMADRNRAEAQAAEERRITYEQSPEFKALQRSNEVFAGGFKKLNLGDYSGSVDDFTEYLIAAQANQNPLGNANMSHAYLNRGVAYFYLQKYQTSTSDFKRARDLAASAQEKILKLGIDEPYFTKFIANVNGWIKAVECLRI